MMSEVSPGALQVQPAIVQKVVNLLSNLGFDVMFGKRRGEGNRSDHDEISSAGCFFMTSAQYNVLLGWKSKA